MTRGIGAGAGARPSAMKQVRRDWRAFHASGHGAACPDLTPSIPERAMAMLLSCHGAAARWELFCARAFDAHLAAAHPNLSRFERFALVGSMPMFLAYLAGKGRLAPRVVDRAFDDCDAIDPWA